MCVYVCMGRCFWIKTLLDNFILPDLVVRYPFLNFKKKFTVMSLSIPSDCFIVLIFYPTDHIFIVIINNYLFNNSKITRARHFHSTVWPMQSILLRNKQISPQIYSSSDNALKFCLQGWVIFQLTYRVK